jgi:hypothetical protein
MEMSQSLENFDDTAWPKMVTIEAGRVREGCLYNSKYSRTCQAGSAATGCPEVPYVWLKTRQTALADRHRREVYQVLYFQDEIPRHSPSDTVLESFSTKWLPLLG